MTKHFNALKFIFFAVTCAFIIFFSTYQLFQSPETWMDEGLIIQSAQGLLETGKASLPVAPGVYEPGWYITTGFPVTIPLAGAFAAFGVSLEVARLVMLCFIFLFFILLWFFIRGSIGTLAGILGFLLLVSFGPIYGNGRNALGELPGLLCILIALLPLMRGGPLTVGRALVAGVGLGLAIAAKPIFILFAPALLLALLLRWSELKLGKVFIYGVLGAVAPLAVWVFTQFDQVTLSQVLAVYANPYELNLTDAFSTNIWRFFTEMQPIYFLGALFIWILSYVVRKIRHEAVALVEEALLFFSVLVFLAYLRTFGYYRYFFPAQVFALLYLPQALWYLVGRRSLLLSRGVIIVMCALIVFQAYETTFKSWVAVHYNSTRTNSIEKYFASLPIGEEIFVYQAPEIVPFAGSRPLYQYTEILPSVQVGKEYRPLVLSGLAPKVITQKVIFDANKNVLFVHYRVANTIDTYVVLVPIGAQL